MMTVSICPTVRLLLLISVVAGTSQRTSAVDETPLAARYAHDRGLAGDAAVVFVEDFETDQLKNLHARWETVRHPEIMSLEAAAPEGSSGRRSLLMSQTTDKGTGADLYRRLQPGHDRVFVRMYVKFAEDCEPMHHFGTCLGGNHPATPWPSVRAGEPPAGDRSFWVGIEPFGKKWTWDYYTYWQDMRGSPPRGQTWGNSFVHDPSLKVRRGHWTCVEVMLKVNDVDRTNGEMALWIDGKKVSHLQNGSPRGKWVFDKFLPGKEGDGVRWNQSTGQREYFTTAQGGDPFEGFRFRSVPELDVNFIWLYVYITKGTPGKINRVWFDDVVVATKYIGPLHSDDGRIIQQP